jgi:hypothetical protein
MSREDERRLGTADLARAGEPEHTRDPERMREPMERTAMERTAQDLGSEHMQHREQGRPSEPLAALFQGPMAEDFRHRWDAIQIGFVDDPRAAVRNADELVAQVLRALAVSFAEQRSQIEAGLGAQQQADTENMRIALQRYRSFFQRLLSL